MYQHCQYKTLPFQSRISPATLPQCRCTAPVSSFFPLRPLHHPEGHTEISAPSPHHRDLPQSPGRPNVTPHTQFRPPSASLVTFRAPRLPSATPSRLDPPAQSAMRPDLTVGLVPPVAVRDSWWGHRPLNLQPRRGRVFDRSCPMGSPGLPELIGPSTTPLGQTGARHLPSRRCVHSAGGPPDEFGVKAWIELKSPKPLPR